MYSAFARLNRFPLNKYKMVILCGLINSYKLFLCASLL